MRLKKLLVLLLIIVLLLMCSEGLRIAVGKPSNDRAVNGIIRVVYSGIIDEWGNATIIAPEIDVDDMPIVQGISTDGFGNWYTEGLIISDGQINIAGSANPEREYRITIVK